MKTALEILDFHHLKKILKKYIQTSYGSKKLEELKPVFNLDKAKKEFETLDRFFSYFTKWSSFTLDDIFISDFIVEAHQSILTEKEIKKIGNFINQLKQIKDDFLEHDEDFYREFISFDIPLTLFDEIQQCIDDYGFLKDTASAHLYNIRQQKKEVSSSINRILKNLMHNRLKEIIMDTAIFLKRNRYTILLKPNYKEYISGRIIDVGKSGGFFVEPDPIFNLNNQLEDLIAREEAERRRILSKLTQMVRDNTNRLRYNEQKIGHLDLTLAKYFYSKNLPECELIFSDKPIIYAKKAKHPILATIKKDTKPVDIKLKQNRGLIVTGPNTGGKTVFLKTIGLTILSIYSGIPVNAESVEIGPFDNVYAIIGDEQDIFESLSGFSAKVQAFKNAYESSTEKSIVLIDEIGSGTSPDEGEAIAYAKIKAVHQKCTICATTHYKKLAYLLQSEGFPTAAFEFDPKTLKPTYKLIYGKVGRSYGIDILKSLKLDQKIIDTALEFYSNNSTILSKLEKELQKNINRYQKSKIELDKTKKRYLELLNSEKKEMERLLNEIKIKQKEKEKEYGELIKALKQEISEILKRQDVSRAHKKLSEITKKSKMVFKEEKDTGEQISLKDGDFVEFNGLVGQLLKLKGNKATVEIDGKILEVPVNSLKKIEKKQEQKDIKVYSKKSTPTIELNLIGKRRDEAYMELLRFIDSLLLENIKRARIVHGLGSGILKDMVRETLKNIPHVKSFRPAPPQEGGDGATIVELD